MDIEARKGFEASAAAKERWRARRRIKHAILRNEPTDFCVENIGYPPEREGLLIENSASKRWVRFGKTNPPEGVRRRGRDVFSLVKATAEKADAGQTARNPAGFAPYNRRARDGSMHTLQLTIAGAGGSIVAQSCRKRVGDVAQLVERRNGIAEATGSTPVVSTNPLFGAFRESCKCLAILPGSITLTHLRRRTALL